MQCPMQYCVAHGFCLELVWGRFVPAIPSFCRELVTALAEGLVESAHQQTHQWDVPSGV